MRRRRILTPIAGGTVALLLLAMPGTSARAQGELDALFSDDRSDSSVDDLFRDIQTDLNQEDLAGIGNSYFGVLRFWHGVDSENRSSGKEAVSADTAASWGWRFDPGTGDLVKLPNKDIPISALLAVPETGEYRVWLRRIADLNRAYPAKLRISGANSLEHVFGALRLRSESSRKQEEVQPIRFEDEAIRSTAPDGECWIWEYWDTELKEGDSLFALTADRQTAAFSHLFISASKSFTPRLPMKQYATMLHAVEYAYSTLSRTYYRFRVRDADVARYRFKTVTLEYHWFFDPKRETYDGIWGVGMGQTSLHNYERPVPVSTSGSPDIAAGEWSDWLDATWASQGAGPWSTGVLRFENLRRGTCEIELAWHPHPAAVVKRVAAEVDGGVGKFVAPLNRHGSARIVRADSADGAGVWGVVGDPFLDWFKDIGFFHDQYATWAREAREGLGIAEAPRIPPGLKMIARIQGNRAEQRALSKVLVAMGFNTLADVPPDICEQAGAQPWLGAHVNVDTCDPVDPARPVLVRRALEDLARRKQKDYPNYAELLHVFGLGDEIGCIAGIEKINQGVASLEHFRRYLAGVLEEKGETPAFFGVKSLDELEGLGSLPRNPGLFERRLYNHSIKFRQLLTADYYRPVTEISAELFPCSLTFANYSPAPMRQGDQVHSLTWFTLPREGAASMAWGEDWVYPIGTFTGYEIVSYLAAHTECAARKLNTAAGFFNVVCGAVIPSDSSIVSSLSRNLKHIYLFSFGPSYNTTSAGAWDGCWSDMPKVYPYVVKALHVAGFVGRQLAEGKIETRKVAVLVNRDHEIMYGGRLGEQSDRALIFAALGNCNRNADLILNEDLVPGVLARYRVLFLNGYCLPRAAVPVLKRWVEDGGLLIASANAAARDEYDSPLPEMEAVFGARQFNRSVSEGYFVPIQLYRHQPIGTIAVRETGFTPEMEADVIGVRTTIEPTTARSVATFEDGACAAALNELGKGHVLLWGVQPGIVYKGRRPESDSYLDEIGRYDDSRLALFEKPLARVLGPSPLSTDAPQVELTRFDLGDETAVLVNNFKKYAWTRDLPPMEIRIRLRPGREISSVASAMHGALKWRRDGDWLLVVSPVPSSIDSLVVK